MDIIVYVNDDLEEEMTKVESVHIGEHIVMQFKDGRISEYKTWEAIVLFKESEE